MRKVKFMSLGGQDELGKSMYCVEINDHIFLLDAGYRFPESEKLGVDIIIPGYQYLKDNSDRISAIFITHGHDDVMGGLPYFLAEVQGVPVYSPSLTADFIEQMIERYERHNRVDLHLNLTRVKRDSSVDIDGVHIEFFPITHSIPGSIGVALKSDEGYIVYGSEYIIDFGAELGFRSNIQKMMEIGKSGVLALMLESSYSRKPGYTSPKHRLTGKIDRFFEEATGRIIISSYAQNVYRTKEIIELTKKYGRKIVFYGRDKYDKTNTMLRADKKHRLPVIDLDDCMIGDKENIGIPAKDRNYVILLSGAPHAIYNDISDILDGGDELLKIRQGDTFIVASPVLPGTERIANKAINDLYRTEAKIVVLKNSDLTSMHASQEDIKVMMQIFKPKYYIPIKGEYQQLITNSHVAYDMGIDDDHVIILDNGERITFDDGVLEPEKELFEIDNVMVDGIGIGDVGEKVIDDRIQLANDGVVVVGVTIDAYTKKIIAQTDCQTRGFIYLKDSAYIVKEIIRICEEVIGQLEDDPYMDLNAVRNMMREQSIRYIVKETGKRPVFLAVIVEV